MDIKIILTSTKHIIQSEMPQELLEQIRDWNLPMCMAEMGMSLYGFGKNLEREELNFAQLCMGMCKVVHVDPEKRFLFIGGNIQEETSALVEYTDNVRDFNSDAFFTQWKVLKGLFFEFQVVDPMKRDSIFCIKGIWYNDKWEYIDIFSDGNIKIIPEGKHGFEN